MTLLSAALWYAEQGIPVFPVRVRGKEPATPNGFYNATTDPEQIRRWWTDNPHYNIGAPTGLKFDVVDLDGPVGRESFEEFREGLPIIGVATTSRADGGEHIFVPATGYGGKVSRYFHPGMDYRGEGSYAVVAPSVGETGRTYQWTQPLEFGKAAEPDHPIYLPFNRPTGNLIGVDLANVEGVQDRAAENELGAACWQMVNVPSGGRNHTLNALAYRLGRLIGAGRLALADVQEQLTQAASSAGLGATETARTISSGLSAGVRDPDYAEGHEPFSEDHELADKPVDWHKAFHAEEDEEWIVKPLLPARRLIALYSPPKVGKSLLALEIAAEVARGGEVLGQAVDKPRRVLYVDSENDIQGDIVPRLKAHGITEHDLDNLQYLSFPSLPAMDTAAGGEQLMEHVEKYGSEVVIIDTISRHVEGEENSNDTWLSWYRHTGKRLKNHGVAVVRLDHAGKSTERGQRGGSAKSGDVDAVWAMSLGAEPETVVLHLEASRGVYDTKHLTLWRRRDPTLRHEVEAEIGLTLIKSDPVEAAVECLIAHDVSPTGNRETVMTFLREHDRGVSNARYPELREAWDTARAARART